MVAIPEPLIAAIYLPGPACGLEPESMAGMDGTVKRMTILAVSLGSGFL